MLTRMLMLVGLVLCGIAALTGAWPTSFSPMPGNSESAFIPKSVPLDANIVESGIGASQLLEKALGKLDAVEAVWLNMKIRQTVRKADSTFVAEGFLQRGPNQCARLEMEIVTHGAKSRVVVVSDGEMLAQVRKAHGAKAIAEVDRLPALAPETPESLQTARERVPRPKGLRWTGGSAALHPHSDPGRHASNGLTRRPSGHSPPR